MAQDATAFIAALKEVWISETIEDQLYQGNPLLDALERVKPEAENGRVASITVHTGRNGGYSAVPRGGSTELNKAGKQKTAKAEYLYTHHWFQVELETAVIDETSGKPLAVADAVETEMGGAVDDIKRQLTRQATMDGSALMAQCAVNGAGTVIKLLTGQGTFGFDAIQRGWIYPDLFVDIGTKANEVAKAENREITAVSDSETEPSITISGANIETAETHYVSIANNRAAEVSNEMDGLLKLISETTKVGGLDPATIRTWKSSVDATEQDLSLDALYSRQDAVFQSIGEEPDWALTSSKQHRALYNLLYPSVRFNGDGGLQAGASEGLKIGKTLVERQLDIPNAHFWFLTKKDLIAIRKDGPKWASEEYGGMSQPVQYVPGTTRVAGALNYRMQFGLKQRNTHAGLTKLK